MDALVDALGTWAAAWDYYDFQGLDLDNGTMTFGEASAPYYGSDWDMSVDPLWQSWQDQPYYDPTFMPSADNQDADIASRLMCGSKCLTIEEFQHNTTVQAYMQSLYNMSMTDPQHREYGAYLWRDADGHIHMDQVIQGTDVDHIYMGIPPGNSIAAIHTHPTLGVVGYGDSPLSDPMFDPGDLGIWEFYHEIGVVVTQHRELYYRPSDGGHPPVATAITWAAY
jgi:hypothetical protein